MVSGWGRWCCTEGFLPLSPSTTLVSGSTIGKVVTLRFVQHMERISNLFLFLSLSLIIRAASNIVPELQCKDFSSVAKESKN